MAIESPFHVTDVVLFMTALLLTGSYLWLGNYLFAAVWFTVSYIFWGFEGVQILYTTLRE